MSGQRARSAIPAELRSAHPNIPGVPWWGAVLIAVVGCAIGFAVDAGAGGGALTSVFSVFYVMGCLIAVLAVRRAGLFTAVIQPPLLLFVIVPGAYFLMHSSEIRGIKDILINCGYPLIERFPLMFFTAAAVLVIGIARRYLGASPATGSAGTDRPARGRMAAKLSTFVGGGADSDAAEAADEAPRRRRAADRRAAAAKTKTSAKTRTSTTRGDRPTKRAAPSRSRHARPPQTEIIEPVVDLDRPRRRRPRPDETPATPTERRRAQPSSAREPREPRVPPAERRERDRQRTERPRPARRPRYDDHDGYEPLEPHAPLSPGAYHPISRVRYRGGDDTADPEYRSRRRAPRDVDADRWEYDI